MIKKVIVGKVEKINVFYNLTDKIFMAQNPLLEGEWLEGDSQSSVEHQLRQIVDEVPPLKVIYTPNPFHCDIVSLIHLGTYPYFNKEELVPIVDRPDWKAYDTVWGAIYELTDENKILAEEFEQNRKELEGLHKKMEETRSKLSNKMTIERYFELIGDL